jgi:hypothetical protein
MLTGRSRHDANPFLKTADGSNSNELEYVASSFFCNHFRKREIAPFASSAATNKFDVPEIAPLDPEQFDFGATSPRPLRIILGCLAPLDKPRGFRTSAKSAVGILWAI